MTLTFTSIVNSNIFPDEFANLTTNNTIEFSKSGRLAVVYAPNGVGKTSFARTLRDGNKERPDIKYDCSPEKKFVVIEDQNGRDIIQGKAGEFFIGHDIVLADKMFAALDTMYNSICGEFAKYLKDVKITGKDSWIIGYLNRISKKFGAFTNALLNSRDKGKTEKYKTVYEILSDSNIRIGNESQDIDNRKYDFFVSHSAGVINELPTK